MGTGKSAAGKLLAERLKRPFVDLDRVIEKEAGRSVAEIFTEEGETVFREREARAVRSAVVLKDHVIATGGGVMLSDENVRLLKASGKLICLTASTEVILQRALASLPSRPLLAGADPLARIEQLLKLRAPFYAQADVTLDTSNRTVSEVVEEILCKIETSKP